MAVPWLALAKAVPWSDVIEHAPGVLQAARKMLSRKSAEAADEAAATVPVPEPGGPPPTLAELAVQCQAARAEAARLRSQLTETQQLLQDLAEQQARILTQVDDNRVQIDQLRRQLRMAVLIMVLNGLLALGLLWKVLA